MGTAKDVSDRALAMWGAGDVEGFGQCYSEDAEITGPGGMSLHGQEGARQFLSVWLEAMPDQAISVKSEYVAGSVVVQEALFTGTHRGNLVAPNGQVIPPTGRHVEVPYADVLTVEGDHIISDHLYWDNVEMLTQLGLMPGQ